MRYLSICLIVSLLCCLPQAATAARPTGKARLEEMTERVKAMKVDGDNSKGLKFETKPLLRFTDPTRKLEDATLWRLGKKGRPKAILILEKYEQDQIPAYEVAVTSNDPPEHIIGPNWTVRPKGKQLEWSVMRNVPKPSANPRLRLSQMKQILRKFKISETFQRQTYSLRMLPKALTEYKDEEAGILAGGIFVFSHGTNAELLLIVEVHKEGKKPENWRVATARVGGAAFEVKFDGKPFRSIPEWRGGSGTYFYFGGS